MKHLNRQIALLAFLLLASGQSMADNRFGGWSQHGRQTPLQSFGSPFARGQNTANNRIGAWDNHQIGRPGNMLLADIIKDIISLANNRQGGRSDKIILADLFKDISHLDRHHGHKGHHGHQGHHGHHYPSPC